MEIAPLLLDPLPEPDQALARTYLAGVVERVRGFKIPETGITRREFEAACLDFAVGCEEVPYAEREYILSVLADRRMITRVDLFDNGETIFPPRMKQLEIRKGRESYSRPLQAGFLDIGSHVGRIYYWLQFAGPSESEANQWESRLNIRRHLEEIGERARKMLAKGVTLSEMREHLSKRFDAVDRERWERALPWLARDSKRTPDEIWPAKPVKPRMTVAEKAMAGLKAAGSQGLTKSQLRKVAFSNNGGDFDGLLIELAGLGVETRAWRPAEKSIGGRPATVFFAPGVENQVTANPFMNPD